MATSCQCGVFGNFAHRRDNQSAIRVYIGSLQKLARQISHSVAMPLASNPQKTNTHSRQPHGLEMLPHDHTNHCGICMGFGGGVGAFGFTKYWWLVYRTVGLPSSAGGASLIRLYDMSSLAAFTAADRENPVRQQRQVLTLMPHRMGQCSRVSVDHDRDVWHEHAEHSRQCITSTSTNTQQIAVAGMDGQLNAPLTHKTKPRVPALCLAQSINVC